MSVKEIERAWIINPKKFSKVCKALFCNQDTPKADHKIGYIANDAFGEMRVVEKESYPHNLLFLTVKSRGHLSRDEWETLIPQWVFDQLWIRTDGSRLNKTRHYIKYTYEDDVGYVTRYLELDVYAGDLKGLYRIECEFESEDAARFFVFPTSVQKCIVEVTSDLNFKNRNLATNGLPPNWKDIFNY